MLNCFIDILIFFERFITPIIVFCIIVIYILLKDTTRLICVNIEAL